MMAKKRWLEALEKIETWMEKSKINRVFSFAT